MSLSSPPASRYNWLVYLLALALLIGPAYTMYVHFDFSHSTDSKSYLQLAQGNFDVTITHRYRVMVPFLAAAIAKPLQLVYASVWPNRPQALWPYQLAFFLVNTCLTAGFGLLLYRTCRAYGASLGAALLAMTAVLVSRWAVYTAGLPLIDSLYLLVAAAAFYGIAARSAPALIFAILVGPHAKESFIFFAPLLLLFGTALPRWQQLLWFALSGVLVFAVRYLIDQQVGAQELEGVSNAVEHVENIKTSLLRMASPKGIGELFSVFGLFTLIPLAGLLGGREARQQWLRPLGWLSICWLLAVLVHVLLSSDVGRMSYLSAPVFAVATALVLDRHPWFQRVIARTKLLQ